MVEVRHGDCLELMRAMPDNSVDAVVTDPPYGLSFMGKKWDYDVPSVEVWAECLRVLKPGGHLLAFAGTRTQHRMAVRIEDAGFEIRDMIAWVYGSGFPKSLDVSKAIDKAAGADREVVGSKLGQPGYSLVKGKPSTVDFGPQSGDPEMECAITAPATDAARQWQGWGTALKPALEPITVARKPLIGTVAANVLAHGTGALNIDGCRVGVRDESKMYVQPRPTTDAGGGSWKKGEHVPFHYGESGGRWPANLIHDGSEEVVGMFPQTTTNKGTARSKHGGGNFWGIHHNPGDVLSNGDTGSAARFFAPQKDSFSLLLCDAKAILGAWKQSNAITAERTSGQPRQLGDIARGLVHLAEACGVLLQGPLFPEHFTSATESEFDALCESVITAIRYIEQRSWRVSQHERHILSNGLVSVAATNEQTGITTITVSLSTSDGYAEAVTFGITSMNTGVGAVASVARFSYCAKASKADRDEGCDGLPLGDAPGSKRSNPAEGRSTALGAPRANHHPTVKPIALMRYLVRLVTPPGGIVLDPFTGSGTTGIAAKLEGFGFIGCEREAEYVDIARARIAAWEPEAPDTTPQLTLF